MDLMIPMQSPIATTAKSAQMATSTATARPNKRRQTRRKAITGSSAARRLLLTLPLRRRLLRRFRLARGFPLRIWNRRSFGALHRLDDDRARGARKGHDVWVARGRPFLTGESTGLEMTCATWPAREPKTALIRTMKAFGRLQRAAFISATGTRDVPFGTDPTSRVT
jgi:hypothetical protein